jgi:O-antigen/teichoic acid export membrane protein
MLRWRVLSAAMSNWAGKLITLGAAFLLTPFILHRLGEARYGLWILAGSLVAHGGLLDLGIGGAVIKYVAQYRAQNDYERLHGLVATALCLHGLLGFVALLLSIAIAPIFPAFFDLPASERALASSLVLMLGIQLAISLPCAVAGAVLQGLQRYDLLNAVGTLGTLTSACATALILTAGGGVLEMVEANIAVALGSQAIAVNCIHRVAPELRFGWRGARRQFVWEIMSFSSASFVIDAAYRIQMKTDEIVIATFLPISAVAPYAIAQRLSGLPQALAEQFLAIFLPLASQLQSQGDKDRLRSVYLAGTRLTLAIVVPLTGVLAVLAAPLLTLWVGAAFAGYAPVVVILAVVSLIEISQWPGGMILLGGARHKPIAVMHVCAALANLALSVLLVRSYGLLGVALGTLIPTALVNIGLVLPYAARVIGVRLLDLLTNAFAPALLPALPMVSAVALMNWTLEPSSVLHVGCTAVAGLTIYAIVYLSFSAADTERKLLRGAARHALGTILPRPRQS